MNCDHRQVALYLRNQLDEDLMLDFLLHVEKCQNCWDLIYQARRAANAHSYRSGRRKLKQKAPALSTKKTEVVAQEAERQSPQPAKVVAGDSGSTPGGLSKERPKPRKAMSRIEQAAAIFRKFMEEGREFERKMDLYYAIAGELGSSASAHSACAALSQARQRDAALRELWNRFDIAMARKVLEEKTKESPASEEETEKPKRRSEMALTSRQAEAAKIFYRLVVTEGRKFKSISAVCRMIAKEMRVAPVTAGHHLRKAAERHDQFKKIYEDFDASLSGRPGKQKAPATTKPAEAPENESRETLENKKPKESPKPDRPKKLEVEAIESGVKLNRPHPPISAKKSKSPQSTNGHKSSFEQVLDKFPEFDPTWDAKKMMAWFDGFQKLLGMLSPPKDEPVGLAGWIRRRLGA